MRSGVLIDAQLDLFEGDKIRALLAQAYVYQCMGNDLRFLSRLIQLARKKDQNEIEIQGFGDVILVTGPDSVLSGHESCLIPLSPAQVEYLRTGEDDGDTFAETPEANEADDALMRYLIEQNSARVAAMEYEQGAVQRQVAALWDHEDSTMDPPRPSFLSDILHWFDRTGR